MTVNHDVVGSSPTAGVVFKEDKFSYLFYFYFITGRHKIWIESNFELHPKSLTKKLTFEVQFNFAFYFYKRSYQIEGYIPQAHDSSSEQQDSKLEGQRD